LTPPPPVESIGGRLITLFGAEVRARTAWVWAKCDITDDQADALWPLVTASSDSSALLVPSLFARDPPNDAGSSSGSLIC
jgi:hypothetical protein